MSESHVFTWATCTIYYVRQFGCRKIILIVQTSSLKFNSAHTRALLSPNIQNLVYESTKFITRTRTRNNCRLMQKKDDLLMKYPNNMSFKTGQINQNVLIRLVLVITCVFQSQRALRCGNIFVIRIANFQRRSWFSYCNRISPGR